MQHAICQIEDYFYYVAYASVSEERRRFFENLSELAGRLAMLCAKLR